MREALGPAIDELEALEALLVAEPRSLVLERCRRLEERSRHLQLKRELRAGPVPSWDDRAARRELRIRMRRVADCGLHLQLCVVRPGQRGGRSPRAHLPSGRPRPPACCLLLWPDGGSSTGGRCLPGSVQRRPRPHAAERAAGRRDLRRSYCQRPRPGSTPRLRDQVQLQSSTLAASSRDLAWGQLISTTVGGWYEWRNLGRTERPAYAALILGYSWGLPQSLHLFLSGIWEAQRPERSRPTPSGRVGRPTGTSPGCRMGGANHDYVAQSLLHLQQHPDLDHDAALAVLGDARTKLEQALAPRDRGVRQRPDRDAG